MTKDELTKRSQDVLTFIDRDKLPFIYYVVKGVANEDFEIDELQEFWGSILDNNKGSMLPSELVKLVEEILMEDMDEGNRDAMCAMGELYYFEDGGKQDYDKAFEYFTKATQHGSDRARENLGYCYYYGRGCEVNYEKAFKCFVRGAFNDRINSIYKLGDMYRDGLFVEQDGKMAYDLYSKANELINDDDDDEVFKIFGADIAIRLADCYFYGIGVKKKDLQEALYYYNQAESLYFPRVKNGDFMHLAAYKRAIEQSKIVREELQKLIPKFEWVKFGKKQEDNKE